MGTWGSRFFESDVAIDWVERLRDQPKDYLAGFFAGIGPHPAYLFAADGFALLAAAATVAGLDDQSLNLPAKVQDWISASGITSTPELRTLAHKAVERVAGAHSELSDMWNARDQEDETMLIRQCKSLLSALS